MILISRAQPIDRPEIESLLAAAELPTEGLELALGTMMVGRDEDGRLVGCAGVEPYGRAGLLRSVAVSDEVRGTGLGSRLVAETERLAAESGISELFLLTESAIDWFPRFGYERTSRDSAPDAVAASPEFAHLCPVSSAVFRKSLSL